MRAVLLVAVTFVAYAAHAQDAGIGLDGGIGDAGVVSINLQEQCGANPRIEGCQQVVSTCASTDGGCPKLFEELAITELVSKERKERLAGEYLGNRSEVGSKPLPSSVVDAIESCTDVNCANLWSFRSGFAGQYESLRIWCADRLDREGPRLVQPKIVLNVCRAVRADSMQEQSKILLSNLRDLLTKHSNKIYTCNGFGLTVPVFSVRWGLNEERAADSPRIRGPVESGIGGGYYWAAECNPSWTFGLEAFGFTEGLDPSRNMQIGVGAGLSLHAFKYFRVGLGVGYDLIRQVVRDDGERLKSGLLFFRYAGRHSLTTFITFSIQSTDAQTAAPETLPEKGGATSPP